MPMDRRLQLQNYSFVLLEQIVIFAVLVDTIPTVLWARTKWGSRIKSGRKTYKKMLFNPGKIISFQTLIRTTTLNSFYASTFGGHLPPFFRGHFNRFFHTAAKLAADLQNPQMPVGAVPLRFKISRMSLCCFITTTFFLCRMGRVCLASVSVGYISEGRNTNKISGQKNQPQLTYCG